MHLQSQVTVQSKAESIYSQITLPQKIDQDPRHIFGLGNEKPYSFKSLEINSKEEDQTEKQYAELLSLYQNLQRGDMLDQSFFPIIQASLPEYSFVQLLKKQKSVGLKSQQKCKLFQLYENTVKELRNQKKYNEYYCIQSELGHFLAFQKGQKLSQIKFIESEAIGIQMVELRANQQNRLKEKLREKNILQQINSTDMDLIILCKQYNRKRKEVLQQVRGKFKRWLQWQKDSKGEQSMKRLSKQLKQLKKNKKFKSV